MKLPDLTQAWPVAKESVGSWLDDRAASMGAALAYYTVFSLAPLLLIVIAVAGLVFGEQAARGEIIEQIGGLIGVDNAKIVETMLANLNQPKTGIVATLVGVAMMAVGATTVFAELQGAMDRIWRSPPDAHGGLWDFVRTRLLSLGMVLGIGFLLIVSLIVSAGLSALEKFWTPWLGGLLLLAGALNFLISFGFLTAMFAMIFKWMPRQRVAWGDVLVGAGTTALLFNLGKSLIGFYIGSVSGTSAFGAAASLVVLLLWVYYSAQIFPVRRRADARLRVPPRQPARARAGAGAAGTGGGGRGGRGRGGGRPRRSHAVGQAGGAEGMTGGVGAGAGAGAAGRSGGRSSAAPGSSSPATESSPGSSVPPLPPTFVTACRRADAAASMGSQNCRDILCFLRPCQTSAAGNRRSLAPAAATRRRLHPLQRRFACCNWTVLDGPCPDR